MTLHFIDFFILFCLMVAAGGVVKVIEILLDILQGDD